MLDRDARARPDASGIEVLPACETLLVAPEEPGLAERVDALRDAHARLWATTPAEFPALGPRSGFRLRLGNEYAATRLIDRLAAEVDRVPEGECQRGAWRESVRERPQPFGAARLGWPEGYGRLLCGDDFFEASIAFTREARAFDPGLPMDGLWQALRNAGSVTRFSLVAIHRGQVKSILQQDAPEIPDARVLAISCEKGGSSVLTDLYLVAGGATPSLERFAFGYGVFLQLLDDLQDVTADVAAEHQTLFTRAARRGPLDEATARLARFIDRVLDDTQILLSPIGRTPVDLLAGRAAEGL